MGNLFTALPQTHLPRPNTLGRYKTNGESTTNAVHTAKNPCRANGITRSGSGWVHSNAHFVLCGRPNGANKSFPNINMENIGRRGEGKESASKNNEQENKL